ncbi:hypothetical protein [Gordonia sp. i37]|uniref:hypothetical protein n=1 Tax=Gordonia sp. i37 TaxID=1961707 RepID=UPI00209B25B1|nr:hypothetical protein [Gordonia sp. i37]
MVLIRPKEYTSAALVELRKQRDSAQATTNTKLLAVGTADDSTANSLRAAAQSHAVTLPQAPTMMEAMINTSAAPPQDEVPNPAELTGQLRQGQIRDVDAATTIARVDTDTVVNGSTTTVLMQDGSRTVITDRTTSAVGNDGVVEAGSPRTTLSPRTPKLSTIRRATWWSPSTKPAATVREPLPHASKPRRAVRTRWWLPTAPRRGGRSIPTAPATKTCRPTPATSPIRARHFSAPAWPRWKWLPRTDTSKPGPSPAPASRRG